MRTCRVCPVGRGESKSQVWNGRAGDGWMVGIQYILLSICAYCVLTIIVSSGWWVWRPRFNSSPRSVHPWIIERLQIYESLFPRRSCVWWVIIPLGPRERVLWPFHNELCSQTTAPSSWYVGIYMSDLFYHIWHFDSSCVGPPATDNRWRSTDGWTWLENGHGCWTRWNHRGNWYKFINT